MSRRRRAKARNAPTAPAAATAPWPAARALPVSVLLFFSGAASLVYETLWVKQLGRVVGVEVHAVSIALSAFFAGLAIGGAGLGRVADRAPRPMKLYAQLEAGVALLGVLSTLALARSARRPSQALPRARPAKKALSAIETAWTSTPTTRPSCRTHSVS